MSIDTVCKNIQNHNFHHYIQYAKIPKDENLIFVGHKHTGKYSQILYYLSTKNGTRIKHIKKICIPLQKDSYLTRISNVHIEVDFYSFGCNAKHMWHTIYQHIISILHSSHKTLEYIVCKNFEYIHPELLDIFYYYIKEKKIRFILHTTSICFLNHSILNVFHIINIKQTLDTKIISYFQYSNKPMDEIVSFIKSEGKKATIDFYTLRENIYSLFIYQYNISECLIYIFKHIYSSFPSLEYKRNIMSITNQFYKKYYNNFRSIYHLEAIIVNYKYVYNEYRNRENALTITTSI